MDTKHIISVALAVAVAAVVFSMVMVPTIGSATETEDTFTNDGLWRMKVIENEDTWTKTSGVAEWTYGTDDVISYGTNGAYNIALGDTWCVRANGTARGTFVAGTSSSAEVISANDVITISGSGITSVDTPAISGYGYSSSGDYVMTNPASATYVNSDTEIYATGWTEIEGTGGVICHITGSIDDGLTITGYSRYGATAFDSITISDEAINYETVSDHKDLYKINSITFTVTAPQTVDEVTTTYTQDITYTAYVAPYEVTAEKSVHADGITISLLNMLPILVAAGLLVGIIGVVFYKFRR